MIALRKYIILCVLILISGTIQSQSFTNYKKFKKLGRPEKYWVLRHPFVAQKAWKITQEVLKVTDSISKVTTLDGDKNGGQVDAFRHAYWTALLAQHIGWRRALQLGRAHERGNFIDYKKHRLEEGSYPDKASGEMDLYNNKVGAKLGKENKNKSEKEIIILVIDAVKSGKMKIIKKDSLGNFLDAENIIIPFDSLQGKWENAKCLVNSDR